MRRKNKVSVKSTRMGTVFLLIMLMGMFAIVFASPSVYFISPTPQNGTITNETWVFVNISSSENLSQALLEWWNASGAYNVSMTVYNAGSSTYAYKNMTNLADYLYTYRVWAENTTGSWNVTEFRYVRVDTTPPVILILSPENGTEYNTTDILLNVSVIDDTLVNLTYEADQNGTIYTLCNECDGASTYVSFSSDGEHNITVYGTDEVFNQNQSTTYFRIGTMLVHIFVIDSTNQTLLIGGANVTLEGSYSTYFGVDQDYDGEIVLSIDSTQIYNITCSAAGYFDNTTTNVSFASTDNFTCYLTGTTEISGKVVNIENESIAIPNATVELIDTNTGVVMYSAQTNESGEFAIYARGNTNYTLRVVADDFVPYEINLTGGQSYSLIVRLYERGTGSISLRVVDAQSGRPIPDARVYAYSGTTLNFSAVTNQSGYARIFVNAPASYKASYKILIEHVDYETVSDDSTHDVSEGKDAYIGTYLTYGKSKIYGNLTDEFNADLPVQNALVELYKWSGSGIGDKLGYDARYFYNATSNETGWWLIHVPTSLVNTFRYAIKITHAGYQTKIFNNNGNGYNGSGMISDNMLMRGKIHINGTVYDATNLEPLSNVTIYVEEVNTSSYPYTSLTTYLTETNEKGYFDLYIRSNDNYTILIYNASSPGSKGYNPFIESFPGTPFEQNISLKGALNLNGRIIDENRDSNGDVIPLAGIDIGLCYYADYVGKTYCYNTTSDNQGRFSINIRADCYYTAIVDGGNKGYGINDTITFYYGEGDQNLGDITLRGTALLQGAVTDSSPYVIGSSYLDNVKITVFDRTTGLNYTNYSSDGHYLIYLPAGRNISIVAEKYGYKPASISPSAITSERFPLNEDFHLTGETHIDGRVVDAENPSISLSGASIVVYTENGTALYNITTNSSGMFSADLGVTSNYYLKLSRDGYVPTSYSCGTNFCSAFMDMSDLTLSLTGAGIIAGEIMDAYTGEYLHNATVILTYVDTDQHAYTKTGIDGNFSINVDSTERFRIKVRQLGYLDWTSDNGGAGYLPNTSFTGNSTIKLSAIFDARVYDYFNNQPVPNAKVTVYYLSSGDIQKEYRGLNITRVNISVSCEGYNGSIDGTQVVFNKTTCGALQQANNLCLFSGTLSNGYILFSRVPVGTYNLTVNASQFGCGVYTSVESIDSSMAGTTIPISVSMASVTLVVNVTDDHSYVVGANVTLWDNGKMAKALDGSFLTALTNASGIVRFDNMLAGDYLVTVYVPAENWTTSLSYTVNPGYNYLHIDALPPKLTGVMPTNNTVIRTSCSATGTEVDFQVNTTESTNLSTSFWSPDYPGLRVYYNTSEFTEAHAFTLTLGCGEWHWNITTCDSSSNCNTTYNWVFKLQDTSFKIYVYDEYGYAVDDGVNVTAANSTFSLTKQTSQGEVIFTELMNNTQYNFTINGSMLGYGTNLTENYVVIWNTSISVYLNVTTLLVNVTNSTGAPVVGANVTLWEDEAGTIMARDALGNPVTALTNASGIAYFTRLLPCVNCNLSVNSAGTNKDPANSFVSQMINITAGNHTYIHIDPPSGTELYSSLDTAISYTVYITVIDEESNNVGEGVNVSLTSTTTGKTITRATNQSGTAVFNVTSGVYKVSIEGYDMGYGRLIPEGTLKIGKLLINQDTTDETGSVEMEIDGQVYYYVMVEATGYEKYDSAEQGIQYYGSRFDNTSAGYGLSPRVDLFINGSATVKGKVFDRYFWSPFDPRYSLDGSTIRLVDINTGMVRYETSANATGGFYLKISPYPVGANTTSNRVPYSIEVSHDGYFDYVYDNYGYGVTFLDNEIRDMQIGMRGVGVIDVYLYDIVSNSPIDVVEQDANLTLKDTNNAWMYSSNDFEKSANHLHVNYNPNYGPVLLELNVLNYNTSVVASGPFEGDSIEITYNLYPVGYGGLHMKVLDSASFEPVENATVTLCKATNPNKCWSSITNTTGEVLMYLPKPGEYDVLADASAVGYGTNSSSVTILEAQTITTRMYVDPNILEVIFMSDEGENVTLNFTLESDTDLYTFMNVTGMVTIYKIPVATYNASYDVMKYYTLANESDRVIEYTTPGQKLTKIIYFNETRCEIQLTNGTDGVGGIDIYLNGYHNQTDMNGYALFRKIIPMNYSVKFNKTQVYVAGYFPPEDETIEVTAGKDENSGNFKQIVLNTTDGYGIVRVFFSDNFVEGAKAELLFNNSVLIDSEIFTNSEENEVFLLTNISKYNTSLKVRVTKEGYEDFETSEFSMQNQEVKEIAVQLVPLTSNQSGTSSGGGTSGSSGTSTSSGGSTTSYTTASTGTVSTTPTYDMYLRTDALTVNLHECAQGTLWIKNTGSAKLTNIHIKSYSDERYSIIPTESVEELPPDNEAGIGYTLCVNEPLDNVAISVVSDQISRTTTLHLIVIVPEEKPSYDTVELRAKLASLKAELETIDRATLSDELKRMYDDAYISLQKANTSISVGDYENAVYELNRAENLITTIKAQSRVAKPPLEEYKGLIFIALFVMIALVAYYFHGRAQQSFRYKHRPPARPEAPIKPALPSIKAAVEKEAEGDKVYYTRPIAKDEFITKVIKTMESIERCEKCGMKLINGKCLRCS